MEQNSDTRARRQHSTVPVDKGPSTLRLNCGLTGNIVQPGSTETPSSMNRRPPGRWTQRRPRSKPQQAIGIFDHHGEAKRPGEAKMDCAQIMAVYANGRINGIINEPQGPGLKLRGCCRPDGCTPPKPA